MYDKPENKQLSYGTGKANPNYKDGKAVGRAARPEEFSEYEKKIHFDKWLDKSYWDKHRQQCYYHIKKWKKEQKLSTMRIVKKEFNLWQTKLHDPKRPPITSGPGKRRGGGVRKKQVFNDYVRKILK